MYEKKKRLEMETGGGLFLLTKQMRLSPIRGGVNITWNIRRTAVTLRERPGHLVNMSIRKRATPL